MNSIYLLEKQREKVMAIVCDLYTTHTTPTITFVGNNTTFGYEWSNTAIEDLFTILVDALKRIDKHINHYRNMKKNEKLMSMEPEERLNTLHRKQRNKNLDKTFGSKHRYDWKANINNEAQIDPKVYEWLNKLSPRDPQCRRPINPDEYQIYYGKNYSIDKEESCNESIGSLVCEELIRNPDKKIFDERCCCHNPF